MQKPTEYDTCQACLRMYLGHTLLKVTLYHEKLQVHSDESSSESKLDTEQSVGAGVK